MRMGRTAGSARADALGAGMVPMTVLATITTDSRDTPAEEEETLPILQRGTRTEPSGQGGGGAGRQRS
ncbi:hypothetical protein MHYP_G00225100 [Metynnis hypsauchen]